jgi:hypothetical protein
MIMTEIDKHVIRQVYRLCSGRPFVVTALPVPGRQCGVLGCGPGRLQRIAVVIDVVAV